MAIPFRAPRGNSTRSRLDQTLEEIMSTDGEAIMQRGYAIVPLEADVYESAIPLTDSRSSLPVL